MRTSSYALRLAGALCAATSLTPAAAQRFIDGLAQPVFAGQPIISHNVWVEVSDLDSDRDGVSDRNRIQVRRPDATENGVKLQNSLPGQPCMDWPCCRLTDRFADWKRSRPT